MLSMSLKPRLTGSVRVCVSTDRAWRRLSTERHIPQLSSLTPPTEHGAAGRVPAIYDDR